MRRLAIFLFALFITIGVTASATSPEADVSDSVAFVNARWQVTDLGKGAVAMYAQFSMFQSMQSICVVRYPVDNFKTEIVHCHGEKAGIPSEIGLAEKAAFAINGGYFHVDRRIPSVYVKDEGNIYGHTHSRELFRVDGLLGFKDRDGQDIEIAEVSDTTLYEKVSEGWHQTIASGPVLVIDGQIQVPVLTERSPNFFDKRHPRAAFGTDDKRNAYLLVIDGRFPGQADGTSIYDTAYICRMLGMTDAINLDGGGSASLWTEKTGVINHPYDNKKFDHEGERRIPNLIIVRHE